MFLLTFCTPNKPKSTNIRQFRSWLADTIPSLKKTDVDYELIVGSDSLSLDFIINYTASIEGKSLDNDNIDIRNLLNLLDEYDELPNENFKLSFKKSVYFVPSNLENKICEQITEIRDLTTETCKEISQYIYIRGRLSGKKVKVKNGQESVFEFNWDNNKLHKVQIN